MSKPIRSLAALTLGLLMTLTASAALAAPTLKLTVPSKEIRGNASYTITLNASEPGFATVTMTQDGVHVATLAENKEIHTKNNDLTATALADDGSILVPGTYTITAVMVDQFGDSSKEVSKNMSIKLPRDAQLIDGVVVLDSSTEKDAASANSTPVITLNVGAANASSDSAAKPASAPKSTAAPKATEEMTYVAGETTVGAEGYEIGVGVSDADKTAKGYWALTSESSDAEIWAAMQEKMTVATVGESEIVYIYDSTADNRKRLGSIAGTSQGFNVVAEVGSWSLVEAFRAEDGAFVRGYIRSNKLRTVEPNPTYGIVIDKKAQTLVVYKDGARIGSTPVSTGLPTPKYPHRETPAGEFIAVTRRGTIEYYGTGNFNKYTIRFGGNYHLSEIPTTKKNGSDYSPLEGTLGKKATRGNIVIAHSASTDGGINAEWIWNLTSENKRIKVLILDDKERSAVPVENK